MLSSRLLLPKVIIRFACLFASVVFSVHTADAITRFDLPEIIRRAPDGADAQCALQPAAPINAVNFISKEGHWQAIAWKLPSCSACGSSPGLLVRNVQFRVAWSFECAAEAEISIVGAVGEAGCLRPDSTNVLCPPTTHPIAGGTDEFVSYTLPFPENCCVTQNAFVLIRFSFEDCLFWQGIGLAQGTVTPCTQYVQYGSVYPQLTDWCEYGNGCQFPYWLWMQVAADCCGATPAEPRSWGSVKSRYR